MMMDKKNALRVLAKYNTDYMKGEINRIETPWIGVNYEEMLIDVRKPEADQVFVTNDGVHFIDALSRIRQHASELAHAVAYLGGLTGEAWIGKKIEALKEILAGYNKEFRWWFYFYSNIDACHDGFFAGRGDY